MRLIKSFIVILVLLLTYCINAIAQNDSSANNDDLYEYQYAFANTNVFNGAENISFKLDYYHTDGYSSSDRYWYEVIILDSLMILNFQSPQNDDWNYISYQKQVELNDSTLSIVKSLVKSLGIQQRVKGIPIPEGSGYGADKLFIDSKDMNVAGGTVYMSIGKDDSEEEFLKRTKKEKRISSSISGDYETLFKELERLFTNLPSLLKDKDQK